MALDATMEALGYRAIHPKLFGDSKILQVPGAPFSAFPDNSITIWLRGEQRRRHIETETETAKTESTYILASGETLRFRVSWQIT